MRFGAWIAATLVFGGAWWAAAIPAAADSPAVTIGRLEAEGFDVNVDRIGNAPLDECVVTNIRNPQEHTRLVRVEGRKNRDFFVPIVVRRTVTVSLDCTR